MRRRNWCSLAIVICGLVSVRGASAELSTYRWERAAPAQQAAADATTVPAGKGAVLVPAMTGGLEPLVKVMQGDEIVATGRTGARIVVAPGHYELSVGSEPELGSVSVAVDVPAGGTVIPRISWGGLLIEVVGEDEKPNHGAYELYRVSRQRSVGLGFGGASGDGQMTRPWLLPPGVYRIVTPGASFDTRREVFSVTVPQGGLVRFRLMTDRNGALLGGTVITPEEAARIVGMQRRAWRGSLSLGVDGALSHAKDTVGVTDLLMGTAGAFLYGQLAYQESWLRASAKFELEEGFSYVGKTSDDRLPLLKTRDRTRLQVLLAYFLGEWIGPYLRAVGSTQLLPTDAFFPSGAILSIQRADGSTQLENIGRASRFRIAKAFSPTVLQGGLGLALNLLRRQSFWLDARAGIAGRKNIFRETLALADLEATPELEYVQARDSQELGLEGSVEASFKLSGWLFYTTTLEYFSAFDQLDDPVIEWRNTLAFRLSRHLSLNYTANVLRQPYVSSATQLQQTVLFRALFDVL